MFNLFEYMTAHNIEAPRRLRDLIDSGEDFQGYTVPWMLSANAAGYVTMANKYASDFSSAPFGTATMLVQVAAGQLTVSVDADGFKRLLQTVGEEAFSGVVGVDSGNLVVVDELKRV